MEGLAALGWLFAGAAAIRLGVQLLIMWWGRNDTR